MQWCADTEARWSCRPNYYQCSSCSWRSNRVAADVGQDMCIDEGCDIAPWVIDIKLGTLGCDHMQFICISTFYMYHGVLHVYSVKASPPPQIANHWLILHSSHQSLEKFHRLHSSICGLPNYWLRNCIYTHFMKICWHIIQCGLLTVIYRLKDYSGNQKGYWFNIHL